MFLARNVEKVSFALQHGAKLFSPWTQHRLFGASRSGPQRRDARRSHDRRLSGDRVPIVSGHNESASRTQPARDDDKTRREVALSSQEGSCVNEGGHHRFGAADSKD